MTAAEEEQENQRVQEFRESIPKMCSQLRILTHFYQVRVQTLCRPPQGACAVVGQTDLTQSPSFVFAAQDGSELPGASPEWRAVCGVSRGPTSDSALALGPEALASSARCFSILECLPSGLPDSACFLVAWKVSSVVLGFPARN